MADQTYEIPEELTYHENIRRLQNSDPGNAEEVFNPLIQKLIENTHFVKQQADSLDGQLGKTKTEVSEALSAAGTAQNTADAALGAANEARTLAEAAWTTGAGALETANTALAAAKAAGSAASDAAEIAYAAKSTAENAATAADKAQTMANGALEQLTKLANTLGAVPTQNGTLTYTGVAQSLTLNGYDPEKMTLGGTTSATNAGTYTATVKPKGDYVWADGTQNTVNIVWTIGKASLNVPTQSGSLAYTGSAQSPTLNGYDSNKMTLGGTSSGANAGSYNANVTPKPNYQWADGTTTAKTVTWTIGKAAGSLSLNKTSLSLNDNALTGEVTVTRAGDGAISASSSNTSVATVSISGTKITVTGKANGSATITVNVAAGSNHNAPASKTISVTVAFVQAKTSATSGVSYTNGLSSITQAKLSAYAKAISKNSSITNTTTSVYIDDGTSHIKLSVGDTVNISLSGTSYAFVIIGFNHDELASATAYGGTTATGKAGITFQMKDCLNTTYQMNSSNTNSGGWGSCVLRTTLNGTIKGQMPSAWQNIIKKVKKKASAGSQSSTINTTEDDLFNLAEIEIFGSTTYSVAGEGNQYAWYKAGNGRVKKVNGSANPWWERSPYASNSNSFCHVHSNGSANATGAGNSFGVAPGFCV